MSKTYLDFNLVESLAVVDSNNAADHLRDNDHVAEVGLDNFWLLIRRSFLLCLTQLLNKGHGLALESSGESSAGSAVHQVHKLLTVNNGCQVREMQLFFF
jgi:hypothetical protein